MNEGALRWKARIGSMKTAGGIILFFLAIGLFFAVDNLLTAMKNSPEPRTVTVAQIVNGEVGLSEYVRVKGLASRESAYRSTEDGKTTDTYYFLVDKKAQNVVVVHSPEPVIVSLSDEYDNVTVEGMTRNAPSGIQNLIKEDISDFEADNMNLTDSPIIYEGQKPSDKIFSLVLVLGLGFFMLLCIVPFFFPGTVFASLPLPAVPPGDAPRSGTQATGRFLRMKSGESWELGRGSQKFDKAVANLVRRGEQGLAIYIHHIVTTRSYGVKISENHSHWVVFLDPMNVKSVEAGRLYGWSDRWAVRFQYTDERQKPATLIASFGSAAEQLECVALVKLLGLPFTSAM